MAAQDHFEVNCNWIASPKSVLKDCIVWRLEDEDNDGVDVLQASSLFVNRGHTEAEHPILSITPKHPTSNCYVITAIDILCSAKNMEVFGMKQEYLQTSPGMKLHLENVPEGFGVYMLQYSFDGPVTACQIKVVSLINKASLWMHSFHISVEQHLPASIAAPILSELSPKIDVSKVKHLLSEMGKDIPSNANSLLSAMEAMQNAQKSQNARMGAVLGNMISALTLNSEAPSRSQEKPGYLNASTLNQPSQKTPSSISALLAMSDSLDLNKILNSSKHSNGVGLAVENSRENASLLKSIINEDSFSCASNMAEKHQSVNADLRKQLEDFTRNEITKCEERLMTHMETLIIKSEQRLSDKLDLILTKLQTI